jgi:hypothetical protein
VDDRRPAEDGLAAGDPSLADLLALDFAVAALEQTDLPGGFMLIAPTLRIASDAVVRFEHPPAVVLEPGGISAALPGVVSVPHGRYQRMLWAFPQRPSWRSWVGQVDAFLAPGGLLAVIGSGPLERPLSALRRNGSGFTRGAIDTRVVARRLRYRTITRCWLYGVRSGVWALLRAAADVFGRPDLADRYEAAFQLDLVEITKPIVWRTDIWVGRKPLDR